MQRIHNGYHSGCSSSTSVWWIFFDDQRAIRDGADKEGFAYVSPPKTEGFRAVREPAEAVSVIIELDDETTAAGDCAAVQYIGAGRTV